jgi:hypothetical protein
MDAVNQNCSALSGLVSPFDRLTQGVALGWNLSALQAIFGIANRVSDRQSCRPSA